MDTNHYNGLLVTFIIFIIFPLNNSKCMLLQLVTMNVAAEKMKITFVINYFMLRLGRVMSHISPFSLKVLFFFLLPKIII